MSENKRLSLDDFVGAAQATHTRDCEHAPPPGIAQVFEKIDAMADAPNPFAQGLTAAARERANGELAAVQTRPVPARKVVAVPQTKVAARGWGWGVAAALVLAGVGALTWSAGERARELDTRSAEQAVFSNASDGETDGEARPAELERAATATRAALEPEPEPEPEPEAEAEPEVQSEEPSAQGKRSARRAQAASRHSVVDRLAELDEQAQAAWRSGDLQGAREAFEQIIAQGGRRAVADMAYGELFTLSRQSGSDELELWRRYLKTFPRGRHADDARAGVCGRTHDARVRECWHSYRADFPSGAHLRTADAALGLASAEGEAP